MAVGGTRRAREREAAAWLRIFVVSSLVCLAAFAANVVLAEVDAGNVWGLTYGSLALALMIGALWLAVRRRTMSLSSRLRLGRSRAWLHFHVYGGLLFMLLVLMHAEFRWPVGLVTTWLFWLSVVTVASGLVGLLLQKWIPRMLASGVTTEVHYERIPELVEEIRTRAAALAAGSSESIRALFAKEVEPALERPRRRLVYFFDVTGGVHASLKEFAYLKGFLPAEEQDRLDELERLYRTKFEIDAHYTLQSALRLWLLSHVPISLLLLAFLLLHLFAVYYW